MHNSPLCLKEQKSNQHRRNFSSGAADQLANGARIGDYLVVTASHVEPGPAYLEGIQSHVDSCAAVGQGQQYFLTFVCSDPDLD